MDKSGQWVPNKSSSVLWNESDFVTLGARRNRIRRVSSMRLHSHQEGIALLLCKGRYYSLNRTGSLVWALIDGRRTVREIAEELIRHFDLDQELALLGTLDVLDALRVEGLLLEDNTKTVGAIK